MMVMMWINVSRGSIKMSASLSVTDELRVDTAVGGRPDKILQWVKHPLAFPFLPIPSTPFIFLSCYSNFQHPSRYYLPTQSPFHLPGVTFWRLAVIDFELGLDVIVYLFTVLCDFACWSILDVVDSRMSVRFWSHV